MKSKILLSPELKARVVAKTREVLDICEKHFKRSFPFPEIRYDIKNRVGGYAYPGQNLIRYNLILLVENQDDYIEQTVPHEVAHIINHIVSPIPMGKKKLMPHGKEWKGIMTLLKVPPKIKHKYDCSSIEQGKKHRRRRARSGDRVQRIMKSILRLTAEERFRLNIEMREIK